MHRLIDKWSFSSFVLLSTVKLLKCLSWLGISTKEDGWRKVTRVYLRTEQSKFALACFGLALEGGDLVSVKAYIIKKLTEIFRQQPAAHWRLKWDRFSAQRITNDNIDIVSAEFNEDSSLKSIIPYFDLAAGNLNLDTLSEELKNTLRQGIVDIYNETRSLDDKIRPYILSRRIKEWLSRNLAGSREDASNFANEYINRILSATFINFETILPQSPYAGYGRFEAPVFIKLKHPGFGIFNIVCRLNSEFKEADLWVQCNHVCIDGLPMQEILQALKTNWGKCNTIKFPPKSLKKISAAELCSSEDDKKGVYCINQIVDFRNFLKYTKEINKESTDEAKRCVTALRLFIWKLGNHPAFEKKKFLIPVNLPARNGLERTLGFVIIRPSIYLDENDYEKGFFEFKQEFNYQAKAALVRNSKSYELLKTYALAPAVLYSVVLKMIPEALRELVGSIGVSMINKAEAFVAPFSDVHTDGFIALSNFFTSTEDGESACYVSIKGPRDKIQNYLLAINEIARAEV